MSEATDIKPEISIDTFNASDIRVGTITKADRIEKSVKMLRLEVFFGEKLGSKQIAAGIGKSYMPESLIGQRVLAVVNLVPVKVMGVESFGMLLVGDSESGESVLLATCPGAPDGVRLH